MIAPLLLVIMLGGTSPLAGQGTPVPFGPNAYVKSANVGRPEFVFPPVGERWIALEKGALVIREGEKILGTIGAPGSSQFPAGPVMPTLSPLGDEVGLAKRCDTTSPMSLFCEALVASQNSGFVPRLIVKAGDTILTDRGQIRVTSVGGQIIPYRGKVILWVGGTQNGNRVEGVFLHSDRFETLIFRSVADREKIFEANYSLGKEGELYVSTYKIDSDPTTPGTLVRIKNGKTEVVMSRPKGTALANLPVAWVDPGGGKVYVQSGNEIWKISPQGLEKISFPPPPPFVGSFFGNDLAGRAYKNSSINAPDYLVDGIQILGIRMMHRMDFSSLAPSLLGLGFFPDRILVVGKERSNWLHPVVLTDPANYDAQRREVTLTGVNLNLNQPVQVVANGGVTLPIVGTPTATRVVARVPDNMEGMVTLRVLVGQVASLNEATVNVPPPPTPPPTITGVENAQDRNLSLIPGQEFVVKGERLRPRTGAFVTIGDLKIVVWYDERDGTLKGNLPENAPEGIISGFVEIDGRRSNVVGVQIQRSGGVMMPPPAPTIDRVVNAVDESASLYPGAEGFLFGTNLVPGCTLTLDWKEVRVLYVDSTQMNFKIPQDFGPADEIRAEVSCGDNGVALFHFPLVAAPPPPVEP